VCRHGAVSRQSSDAACTSAEAAPQSRGLLTCGGLLARHRAHEGIGVDLRAWWAAQALHVAWAHQGGAGNSGHARACGLRACAQAWARALGPRPTPPPAATSSTCCRHCCSHWCYHRPTSNTSACSRRQRAQLVAGPGRELGMLHLLDHRYIGTYTPSHDDTPHHPPCPAFPAGTEWGNYPLLRLSILLLRNP